MNSESVDCVRRGVKKSEFIYQTPLQLSVALSRTYSSHMARICSSVTSFINDIKLFQSFVSSVQEVCLSTVKQEAASCSVALLPLYGPTHICVPEHLNLIMAWNFYSCPCINKQFTQKTNKCTSTKIIFLSTQFFITPTCSDVIIIVRKLLRIIKTYRKHRCVIKCINICATKT